MSDEDIPSQGDSVSKHVEILKIQETFESVEGSLCSKPEHGRNSGDASKKESWILNDINFHTFRRAYVISISKKKSLGITSMNRL